MKQQKNTHMLTFVANLFAFTRLKGHFLTNSASGRGVALVWCLILAGCSGGADDPTLFPLYKKEEAAVAPELSVAPRNERRNLYFGDLHIHTSFSTDAFVMGVRAVPEDAYRFAKGQTIEHGAGYPIKIRRPLDFAAVTDHAEYLGQARDIKLGVPLTERPLRSRLLEDGALSITNAWMGTMTRMQEFGFAAGDVDKDVNRKAWREIIRAADAHYIPGAFTTFVGYEWSAHVGDDVSVHIHRNVIYRGNNVSDVPFSSLDSNQPEGLWDFLDAENSAGRTVFAIPHNANISNGNMYGNLPVQIDEAYASRRNSLEPVHEILQVKGASEVHPLLSADDEFADFSMVAISPLSDDVSADQLRGSFSRYALLDGIESAETSGVNPLRFGVIGSSDSHNASSPVEEDTYHGKLPMMDGSAGLRTSEATLLPVGISPANSWSSGGLAAVWAEENTRESIFDALRRRETFATSGPRIAVRFFAGDQIKNVTTNHADVITRAYESGVPMGSMLPPETRSPSFLVMASKDPDGANLDRIQIVKGWVDASGVRQEEVIDIAWSGERGRNTDGSIEPIVSTVDIAAASYQNDTGAASLEVVWQDPVFRPEQHAFYYVRVLEIPTPRWSTYDARRLGSEPLQPAVIQERAITSAIWHQPE